ncbi:hypothetical protein [Paenibacillus apis]|uniref:Uncharacterized protein n=1 Tax=Paenibacillus apis TaxID=1792174 RepID=A0A920CI44_9BACL|nr:hypothetical protein [Paenibacillus apis]GIO41186.1 hypothetical protein J41TS4_09440 [Paenibacillus apis]
MTSIIPRSIRPLTLIILIISIVLIYGYLKILNIGDLTTMLLTIFGGKPLPGIMLKSLFIMTFLLLQYINVDYISFCIDNMECLSIRYESKKRWLKVMLTGSLVISAFFVVLFYVGILTLHWIWGDFEVLMINLDTFGVISRIYLFCIIMVLLQIYLSLKLSKSNTFMIMILLSIILSMISHYQNSIVGILPQYHDSLDNVVGNLVLVLVLILLIKKASFKKELSFYES